jgi:hypothetical protein
MDMIYGILHSSILPRSNVTSLISCCRQIRRECLELINSDAKKRPQHLELDVMAKGETFWPTWTCLPPLLATDAPLDITVQIRVFTSDGFQAENINRQDSARKAFLRLLNQFLHCGPGFSAQQAGLKLTIRKLTVQLVNLDIYTPRTFPRAVYDVVRMCKALALRGDARQYVQHIRVVVDSKDMAIPGHEGREWNYDVLDEPNTAIVSQWESAGYHLRPEVRETVISRAGPS